jgi:ABC-2 type transport system ATP-binding protein
MTIKPYLGYMAAVHGLTGTERRRRVDQMVDACGLSEVLDREIGQLSRGYRQRVGLAATLIHDPDFLILDEPTTGLDPNQIVEIRRLIREIATDKTIILSTHILPEVEATCDRVIIISEGVVKADSTAAALTAAESGSVLYTVAAKGDPAHVESVLGEGAFVKQVEAITGNGDVARFRVTASSEGGGAERLFQLAVAKGLVLVELVEIKDSLEEVFAQLTKGGE